MVAARRGVPRLREGLPRPFQLADCRAGADGGVLGVACEVGRVGLRLEGGVLGLPSALDQLVCGLAQAGGCLP